MLPLDPPEHYMRSTELDPLFSVADIGVFSCAKCGRPMKLSCIEPGEPGFETRMYECEKCNQTAKFAASI